MQLMEYLLTINPYSRPGKPLKEKRAVILHWTGVPGQRANTVRDFFESAGKRKTYGSAHYCVDQDGTILRLIPDNELAYHCGSSDTDPASGKIYTDWAREMFGAYAAENNSPNNVTIGIEMCVIDNDGNFTQGTLNAAAELTAELCRNYGIGIIGTHHGVVGWKDCPRLWTRRPELFEEFKKQAASITGA